MTAIVFLYVFFKYIGFHMSRLFRSTMKKRAAYLEPGALRETVANH